MLRVAKWVVLVGVVLVLAGGAFLWFWGNPAPTAPGELLATEPQQRFFPGKPFQPDVEHIVIPLARFQIDGRVLARKDYTLGPEARFSPVDLVLGWGLLSEPQIAGKVRFSQADRSFSWKADGSGLEDATIRRNTANLHLIPATPEIQAFLATVVPGEYLSLKGELIGMGNKAGWRWMSSFTREDLGPGSGEILYVKSAEKFSMMNGQPVRAATSLPEKGDLTLQAPLRVTLKHGKLTIPAQATVTLLGRKGEKTIGLYNGLEFVVETKDIR